MPASRIHERMRSAAARCSEVRKIRAKCSGVSEMAPSWSIRPTISSPSIDLSDADGIFGEMAEVGVPVLCDCKPRRHPDPRVAADVIEKPHQRCRAAGPPDQPAMEADRHHFRRGFALGIEHIKTVLQIGEELIAAAEALRIDEA